MTDGIIKSIFLMYVKSNEDIKSYNWIKMVVAKKKNKVISITEIHSVMSNGFNKH